MRVVLLHGLTNSSHAFDRLVPLLDGFDVVTIDLPGHGSRAASPGKRTVDAFADAVIPEIAVPSIVVGHSLGGSTATAVAEHRPGLISHLVLVNSPPSVASRRLAARGGERALRTPVLGPILWQLMPRSVSREGLRSAFAPRNDVPEFFVDDMRRLTGRTFVDGTNAVDAYVREKTLYERVRSLGIPTTIVFGEEDQRINPASLAGYASTSARVVTVAGAGHTPTWEKPEAVAAVLRSLA
jgi:pimeloyl-ACP methyl ester carboxylesterase